ncbi:MAG: TPM domain-containing protein [Ginsengibacter sp.]
MQLLFLLLLSIFSFWLNIEAQSKPNYNQYKKMSATELQIYRQSTWDSLPVAVGWVNDFEGLFTNTEEDSLRTIIGDFEKITTVEIAIVTIDSNMVEEERFNDFTDHLRKTWGVGKFIMKNGVVVCISKDYKKLFISTGVGINKFMNDYQKYEIIKKYFIPSFNSNDYFSGTIKGINAIISRINRKTMYNR